jgi:hypothetical protein
LDESERHREQDGERDPGHSGPAVY